MSSLLDTAPRIDLVLPTDSPRTFAWTFTDENGLAIDYTGSTFDLKIKARDANNNPTGSVLHTLTTGSGIAGTLSAGEFNPTFPEAGSWSTPSPAGAYIYEARRLVAATPVEPMLVGLIDVETGLS